MGPQLGIRSLRHIAHAACVARPYTAHLEIAMNIFASPSRAPGQAGQTYNENWSETTMNHDAFDAHEPPRSLSVGEHLFLAGERNGVWQLSRGLVRLESVGPSGTSFVRLAMPGDLLGAECALHQPYAFNAVAVTDCEVTRVDTGNDMQRMLIVMTAFLQEQSRAADAMRMRQGSVAARLDHLLQVLNAGMDESEPISVRQRKLPQLRDLAFMIDSTPESACRYLSQHLGLQRQRRYRRTAAVKAASTHHAVPMAEAMAAAG